MRFPRVSAARHTPATRAAGLRTLPDAPTLARRLVSVLGFVSQSQDPVLGAFLLLMYSLASTSLVLAAGVLTGTTIGPNGALRSVSPWVTPAAGATLLTYGTYSALGLVFGR